jgi:GPI-anchor transamidase subunit U
MYAPHTLIPNATIQKPDARSDLQYPIVTTLLQLHGALLLPLLQHVWLATGTGNANFFYASTLAYGLASGGAVLDALWAGLRIAMGGEKEGVVVVHE